MRVGLTRQDIADYCEMGARALWAMGCRPGDIVFECMNYNLYAGGVSDHMNFETLGAATIPYGVGHSERLIQMMAGLKSDLAIWATPSYAIRLAEVARQAGTDPRSIKLRKGFFSGEAGMQVPGYRERIEEIWGMVARDQYGTGELGIHSGECEQEHGVHFGGTGFVVIELINPDTGEVLPFEDGAQGEAVATPRSAAKPARCCACAPTTYAGLHRALRLWPHLLPIPRYWDARTTCSSSRGSTSFLGHTGGLAAATTKDYR